MSFKIIKKITLAPSNEPFFNFINPYDFYRMFVILSADVIQGEFIGYGKLRRWQGEPESMLEYQKLGESLDNIYSVGMLVTVWFPRCRSYRHVRQRGAPYNPVCMLRGCSRFSGGFRRAKYKKD